MITAAETSQQWCKTMTNNDRELNAEELGSVTGAGLVDTVSSDAEATTAEFLKKFADSSQRFSAFINAPPAQAAASTGQE
jgi:hypothetical protein